MYNEHGYKQQSPPAQTKTHKNSQRCAQLFTVFVAWSVWLVFANHHPLTTFRLSEIIVYALKRDCRHCKKENIRCYNSHLQVVPFVLVVGQRAHSAACELQTKPLKCEQLNIQKIFAALYACRSFSRAPMPIATSRVEWSDSD